MSVTEKEQEEKQRKRNLKLMIIIAVMFLIGILIRWDYTKTAVKESIMDYFGQTDTLSGGK